MANFREKRIVRMVEDFTEMVDEDREKVLDQIKYNGVLKAAAEVNKTQTRTFREGYDEAKRRQQFFNRFEGFGTGLKYFDDATMGFRSGEVTIIAGPSNFGKTMIALNVLATLAEKMLKPVLIISMEMTSDEIFSRVYNIATNHEAVKDNLMVQTELVVSPEHIARIIARDKPALVMIDHLQFLANAVSGNSEYERIGLAIAQIKRIAITQNLPIILISHVAKTRSGGKGEATNADLKGASNIEQDSDIVIMLNRPKDSGVKGNQIICTLTKHRTKKPGIFLDPCVITLEGIKVANDGDYFVYA